MATSTSLSHLDFSVTDVEKSAAWYCDVQHSDTRGDRFDEHRPGLDHVGFSVMERAELDEWQARLAELRVDHSPVQDSPSGSGSALVFRDPDNIQLEFWWTAPR